MAWREVAIDTTVLLGFDGTASDGDRETTVRAALTSLAPAVGACVRRLEVTSGDSDFARRNRLAADILAAFLPACAGSLDALYCEPVSIPAATAELLRGCSNLRRLDAAFEPASSCGCDDANATLAFLSHLPHLQRLKLDLGHSMPVPPAVLQLTNLTHLSLELLSGIPAAISRLTCLRKLAITDYHGPHEFPTAIVHLPSLVELHIDWHYEQEDAVMALPPEVAHLRRLRQLSLTPNCQLAELQNLERLPDLNCLYLDCCKLRKIPEPISALRELRELGVTANRIALLPAWITRLSKLRALDLSYQAITQLHIAPEVLRMPSLKKVYLVDVDAIGFNISCTSRPELRLAPSFAYPRSFEGWDLLVARFTGDIAATEVSLGLATELHRFCAGCVEFDFDANELTDPWSIDGA